MDAKNIKITFMGLFETVSSFGFEHHNDVKKYHLDSNKEDHDIRYIVHLTAIVNIFR